MFYSDKPIGSNNEDMLNRKGFAKILARTLVHLESRDTFTVGLFGKWGSGKTSLVNMTLTEIESIQAERKTEDQIIVVHFEPWNFTDTNQLLTQFFIRLANEFQNKEDRTLTKIGKALEKYSDCKSCGSACRRRDFATAKVRTKNVYRHRNRKDAGCICSENRTAFQSERHEDGRIWRVL